MNHFLGNLECPTFSNRALLKSIFLSMLFLLFYNAGTGQSLNTQGALCAGSSVTLYIQPGGTCTTISATGASSWSIPSGTAISFNGNFTQAHVTWTAAGTYYVNVSYQCSGGGSGSVGLNVTINPSVTPTASLAVTPSSLCQGSSLTLTASGTNGGTPTYSFYIDGASVQSGTSTTYSTSSLSAGAHSAYVVMSSSLACATSSTVTSSTQNFTITAPVSYTVTVAGPASICSTSPSGTFYANPSTSYGTLTYAWYLNGAPVGSNSSIYTASSLTQGSTVYCRVTSNYACITAQPVQSNTYTVNITSAVTPTALVTVSYPNNCQGSTFTFTASGSNGGSPSYSFYVDGALKQSGSSSTYSTSALVAGAHSAYVLMTSSLSCITAPTATSVTQNFSVVAPSSYTVAITGPSLLCSLSPSGIFTATASAAYGNLTYQWYLNGATVGTNSNSYGPVSLSQGNTVYCNVSSDYTCLTSSIVQSNTFTANIIQSPTVTASNQSIFSSQKTSITLSSPGASLNYSPINVVNVSGALSDIVSPISQSLTVTDGINPGSVTYAITPTANGCTGNSVNAIVTVFPIPVISAPQNYVVKGVGVTLNVGSGYDSYQWTNSASSLLGTSSMYNATLPDTYSVLVAKSGASISVSFVLGTQLSGVNENYMVANTIVADNVTDATVVPNLSVDLVNQNITYYDGLGRPFQTITTQASPQRNDVVLPNVYDVVGREPRKYLPVTYQNNGRPKTGILDATNNYVTGLNYSNSSPDKVTDDPRPFSETIFEASPLNRPLQDFGPGAAWSQNSIGHQYLTNQANEVLLFTYDNSTGMVSSGSTTVLNYYGAGQLSVKKTADEHGNEVIEYVDKESHTVCKKVQSGGTDAQGNKLYASTYYIYDNLGNLVVVLPPEAIHSALNAINQH